MFQLTSRLAGIAAGLVFLVGAAQGAPTGGATPIPPLMAEIAHRGDPVAGPQNTMAAIDAAVAAGARFIEIDVYLNSNNEPIVTHDRHYIPNWSVPTFDQVAGPTYYCHGKNFEVDSWVKWVLVAGVWVNQGMSTCDVSRGMPGHTGATVPLLADVIARHRNSGSIFMIELKKSRDLAELGRKVGALLVAHGQQSRYWVTSFEAPALAAVPAPTKKMRQYATSPIGPGFIVWGVQSAIDDAKANGYQAVNLDLEEWTRGCASLGGTCVPWSEYARRQGLQTSGFTIIGTQADYHRRAMAAGLNYFMTDLLADLRGRLNRAPLAPNGAFARPLSANSVQLLWSDIANNESRTIVSNGSTNVAVQYADSQSVVISGLNPKQYMCFSLKNENIGGGSAWTPYTCTSTFGPPNAPSNVVATATGTSTIRVTWRDNSNDETRFVVSEGTYNIGLPAANVTEITMSGLAPSTQKCFWVKSENNYGGSAWIGPVCATTWGGTGT